MLQNFYKTILEYRELIYYFTWREFKVRYKQTVIGVLWVVFQPLFFALIINLTLLRGRNFGVTGLSIPAFVPVYIGLLFWNYFEQTINAASNSLIGNQGVITKVYFPRFIPALSTVIASLVDFLFAALLLFILLPLFARHAADYWGLFVLIPCVLLLALFTFGAGLLLATLNVKYRDLKYVLPFIMRIALFASPVFYPITFLPEKYWWILYINPVTTAAELGRHFVLGIPLHRPILMLMSVGSTILALIIGGLYFKARERQFVDII
jgi:lipopolysaccharide transport system permease protein